MKDNFTYKRCLYIEVIYDMLIYQIQKSSSYNFYVFAVDTVMIPLPVSKEKDQG